MIIKFILTSITLTTIIIIMTVMSCGMTKIRHGMTIFLRHLILSKKKLWWMTKILWRLLGKVLSKNIKLTFFF